MTICIYSSYALPIARLHVLMQGEGPKVFKSDSVFKSTHAALQALYKKGRLEATSSQPDTIHHSKLKQDPGYQHIYEQCQDKFKLKRGEALPADGPHANTEQSTFTLDEFTKIAEHMVASANPLDARDWSMMAMEAFTCGRGDDARERFLAELFEPKLRRTIGKHTSPLHISMCMFCLSGSNAVQLRTY